MGRGRKKKLAPGSLASVVLEEVYEKQNKLSKSFFSQLAPPELLWMDEWADDHFVLPSETSKEFGPWKTDRTPYLRRPLRCLSPKSKVKKVTFVSGSQIGKTTLFMIWYTYSSDRNPGPAMYVRETDNAVKEFSVEKLAPTIKACTDLDYILGNNKPTQYTNTVYQKSYPGGFIFLGTVGSETTIRGKSIRDIGVDEVDAFPRDVKSGGSPFANLEKRQSTFSSIAKTLMASTPKIEETSLCWPSFLDGSQEHYYITCPYCNPKAAIGNNWNNWFKIEFENIKYSKDNLDPISGYPRYCWLECPFCGERIEEHQKNWMLPRGYWLSNKGNDDKVLYEVGFDVDHVSLRLPAFYSPFGFYPWSQVVKEWFDYRKSKDITLYQVFLNQTCALPFSMRGREIPSDMVSSHIEEYINDETGEVVDVPLGVLCLTSGVDIQNDRIEVAVYGWGLYGESWAIDYKVFWGNTDLLGDTDYKDPNTGDYTSWGLLSQYLKTVFTHASGRKLRIECTLIDSNYKVEPVHAFCRLHENFRVYPCIGKNSWGKGVLKRPSRRTERYGTWQVFLNTWEIKDILYNNFKISDPGPGFCHFPNKDIFDEKFFKGLTCEYRKEKRKGGRVELVWETPTGARNEPLDTLVYAYGAFIFSAINVNVRAKAFKNNEPLSTSRNLVEIVEDSKKPKRIIKRKYGSGHGGL